MMKEMTSKIMYKYAHFVYRKQYFKEHEWCIIDNPKLPVAYWFECN